jgi:hypothetical protein
MSATDGPRARPQGEQSKVDGYSIYVHASALDVRECAGVDVAFGELYRTTIRFIATLQENTYSWLCTRSSI